MKETLSLTERRANARWAHYDVPTYQRRNLPGYNLLSTGYQRPAYPRKPVRLEVAGPARASLGDRLLVGGLVVAAVLAAIYAAGAKYAL